MNHSTPGLPAHHHPHGKKMQKSKIAVWGGLTNSCEIELRRPWGFSPEARRGSQGASRAAPGKSGLPARSEEERVVALE